MRYSKFKKGTALIISIIFLAVFSALAVSLGSISSVNLQLAENHQRANRARANAESGLETIRFWLGRISMQGTVPPSQRLSNLASLLQDDLTANGISNIAANYDGSTLTIPSVPLSPSPGQSFSAVIQQIDDTTLQVDIIGSSGRVTQTIRTSFALVSVKNPIFDFGLATKGPVYFYGNPMLTGTPLGSEASIFIDSPNDNLALLVTGNTNFDGDVTIGNETAYVDLQGDVAIGGETSQAAIDNHVSIGAETPEFPLPDTAHFEQYATGPVIDATTDTTTDMTLTNAKISAGTNPTFGGNVGIEGILFIESPNILTFNNNAQIQGMIVGDGDAANPGTNKMTFLGNFQSSSYPAGSEFDAIRDETGSSLLAPGFALEILGNFSTLGGVMAVSGARFAGNVNATIQGTIINYSDSPTVIEGNASLTFDRTGITQAPAGFEPLLVLQYQPGSYSEIAFYHPS